MEFEFDSDGFLTDRSDDLERGIRIKYLNVFEFSKKLNRECHELLFGARVHQSDGRAILAATLFMRALEHYQATVVLLGRGAVAAARVALRALVESTFRLRAVATREDAWRTFMLEDDARRLKIMNKAMANDYPNLEALRAAVTDQTLNDLKEKNKATGARSLTTEEWSRQAEMHDWYITNYALLSKAVHTEVRDLESYLVIDEHDDVKEFLYAPSIDEIPFLTLTAAHLLLICATAYDNVFQVGFGPKAADLGEFVDSAFDALDNVPTGST